MTSEARDEPGLSPVRPASHKLRRRFVGALVAATLVLAGIGATYWLNADTVLPPLPLSPSLLSEPPKQKPSQDGWELLDPASLAVDARPVLTNGEAAPSVKAEKNPPAVQVPDPAPLQRPAQ
jgi:hypothetical protein